MRSLRSSQRLETRTLREEQMGVDGSRWGGCNFENHGKGVQQGKVRGEGNLCVVEIDSVILKWIMP